MTSGGSSSLPARLRAFAKLYGYVRFFHPSDAAAEADWDALARGAIAELVASAEDPPPLGEQLTRLLAPVAPTLQLYATGDTAPVVDLSGSGPSVAWQHRGFGVGVFGGGFESARTGRARRQAIGRGRAAVSRMVGADSLRGATIRLCARVRVDARAREDHGALWMRIDGPDLEAVYFDNMSDRPVRSSEWVDVELETVVGKDAASVAFGAIANCEGAVYFSGFTLERMGPTGEFEAVELENMGFEDGTIAAWSGDAPDFIYEVIEHALTPGEQGAGAHVLRMARRFRTNSRTLFEQRPAAAEVRDLELIGDLRVRLPVSMPGELAVRTGEGGPQSKDEGTDPRVECLAAVIAAWNVLHHFYPYFDVIEGDWEVVLDETLMAALDIESAAETHEVLERLLANLQDGQARVLGPDLWVAPMRLARVEGKIIVTAARAGSGIEAGDELLSIDGVAIEDALARASARISGAPHYIEAALLEECRVSEGPPTAVLDIELRRGSETLPVSVVRSPDRAPAVFDRPAIFTNDEGVFVVELERVLWRDIETHLLDLAVAPGVIFDLRTCSSAKLEFLAHLMPRSEQRDWMFVPRYIYPNQVEVSWDSFGLPIPVAQPSIGGKVAFLVGPRTIAGAETILGFVQDYGLGTVVGATSAGANGNINMFPVSGGFHIAFTGMKVTRLDGSQHHGKGVEASIEVGMTQAGILAGRDEVLEAAFEHIR